jgi:hypothetical protein
MAVPAAVHPYRDGIMVRGDSQLPFATISAQFCRAKAGRPGPLCPGISDVNLLRYRKGVIDLYPEVSDGAFNLGVAEQELDGSQVACASID